MPPLKGNLPNGFASCALRMAILREAVNSRIKAGCQRARPFTLLNGVGNTLGAQIQLRRSWDGGDWCPFAGRLMQNRHSCRLFQVVRVMNGLPYARRVRLNQALPSPFEPKSTTAAERTISSPTQMHIGTFSFKEFPKVACDKGLVLDNEDRAPGKRRDASHVD